MSFRITCPHCNRGLNITEPAFGKTLPCPGCQQPIKVPHPTSVPSSAPVRQAAPWTDGTEDRGAQASPVQLPSSMPPVSDGQPPDDPFAFLRSESATTSAPPSTGGRSSTDTDPFNFLTTVPRAPADESFGRGGKPGETICPFCHKKHAISEATVRKQMQCPGCHHTFTANPVTGLGIAIKTPPPTALPSGGCAQYGQSTAFDDRRSSGYHKNG